MVIAPERRYAVEPTLHGLLERIEKGQWQDALRMLDNLSCRIDMGRIENQLIMVIATALCKRAAGPGGAGGNLYLRDDEELPHMRLFTLLRERVPMVFMTYPIANELLLPYVYAEEQAVIFDIGIGMVSR